MLGHDCLEVCLYEAECEVGWFVPWSVCVRTCIFIRLISLPPHKPRDLGVPCLILKCCMHYWVVSLECVLDESVSLPSSCFREGKGMKPNSGYWCPLKVRFDGLLESRNRFLILGG